MRDFQQRTRLRSILHSKPVLFFLTVLLLIFAYGVFGFMGKMGTTIENRKIADNKVAQLLKDTEKLTSDIAKLKTEEGIEESIRLKFGLAKEGEGMIVVVEDKNQGAVESTPTTGFWSFLKKWFK